MRRSIVFVAGIAAVAASATVATVAWRRNPRMGTRFVNAVVDRRLLRRGLAGSGRSEIGALEHIGRVSGIRRLTPVHPEPIPGGFRIIVPLGQRSQWARNVLAAGRCRVQLHDVVYELDEPRLIPVTEFDDVPRAVRSVMGGLGFAYLTLRIFGAEPGVLEAEDQMHDDGVESVAAAHAALPFVVAPTPDSATSPTVTAAS